jgi:[ribosomal protein S18]-alanine N-acetyltransferase
VSALLQCEPAAPLRREPMRITDLGTVQAIENVAYEFPWTRGNFVDSLAAGYPAHGLRDAAGVLWAYSVAMAGVQEMHLLNLTVAPPGQHRGLARLMLDALVADSRAAGAQCLWLEVRASNQRAQAVYRRYGFEPVGVRRGYYPAAGGQREDALVMRLGWALAAPGGSDALD